MRNSIEFMSLLKRLIMRPIGTDSKNCNFDRRIDRSILLWKFRHVSTIIPSPKSSVRSINKTIERFNKNFQLKPSFFYFINIFFRRDLPWRNPSDEYMPILLSRSTSVDELLFGSIYESDQSLNQK